MRQTVIDRIKLLISKHANNNLSDFVRKLNEVRPLNVAISQQRLDKVLKSTRKEKIASIASDIIEAIVLRFPEESAYWIVTGKKESGPSTEPDRYLPTLVKKEIEVMKASLARLSENLPSFADPSTTPTGAEGFGEVAEDKKEIADKTLGT